jgi:hypothetical protein
MASKRSDETDHSQNRTAVLSGFDRIVTALAYTPILPYADTPTRRYSLYADTAAVVTQMEQDVPLNLSQCRFRAQISPECRPNKTAGLIALLRDPSTPPYLEPRPDRRKSRPVFCNHHMGRPHRTNSFELYAQVLNPNRRSPRSLCLPRTH